MEFKENTALIIGSAPVSDNDIIRASKACNLIIAADGGIGHLLKADIRPDIWAGDMDSTDESLKQTAEARFPDTIIKRFPSVKDDTDMALCVKTAADKGYRNIIILGGTGGSRIDHMLANIQLMHNYKDNGVNITMKDNDTEMFCLSSEERSFSEDQQGYISLLSLTDHSTVSVKGLFYEYEGALYNSYALGVSNEFCGKRSFIKVTDGMILVVRSPKDCQIS